MDKKAVIEMVVATLVRDLRVLVSSVQSSNEEASHEQNKPENKYDTRALEASYLARGQSRQVVELERAIQEFQALSAAPWPADEPIDLGALLVLKSGREEDVYLLGPKGGGVEVVCEGTTVTVITPQSPIGRLLVGKVQGETIVFPSAREARRLKIAKVL